MEAEAELEDCRFTCENLEVIISCLKPSGTWFGATLPEPSPCMAVERAICCCSWAISAFTLSSWACRGSSMDLYCCRFLLSK